MGAANKLYNGNIAETFWSTATDGGFVRNYGYKYDNLNRLKDATYQKSGQLTGMYNENLSYDKNGNIMNLSRNGDRDEQYLPIQIDNLQYGYATNSNKLISVVDNSNNTSGFKDGITTGDDYAYDANGNMTVDKNKNITSIVYNHLNLPTKIIFPTGNILYFYTASGQKVQKVVTENTTVTTTDYLGGYHYQNTVLQFFPTAEGYVKNTPVSGTNTYSYVFNYTDHLGNTRLSYIKDAATGSLKILEENNYYPFGLKHTPYNAIAPAPEYKYKYNGKELQDENIEGNQLNMYDYGARNYDPALGRWMNIDPLAETSRRFSPYTYALNNPVFFIDPDGMEADDWKKDDILNNTSEGRYRNFMDGYDGSRGLMGNADGGPIDPPKSGQGTSTGNAQGVIPVGQPGAGLPNGVDLPAIPLNEVVVKGYKAPSYFQGYFDGPNSKKYGPSSMNPDGYGLTISGSVDYNYTNYFVSFSLVLDSHSNTFAGFGTAGAGLSTSRLSVGLSGSIDIHGTYGDTSLFEGLKGYSKGGSASFTDFGASHFQSSLINNKGQIIFNDKAGINTNSIFVNLKPSIGISGGFSYAKRLF